MDTNKGTLLWFLQMMYLQIDCYDNPGFKLVHTFWFKEVLYNATNFSMQRSKAHIALRNLYLTLCGISCTVHQGWFTGKECDLAKSTEEKPFQGSLCYCQCCWKRHQTGNNLHLVRDLSGSDPLCCRSGQVKKVMGLILSEVSAEDMRRLGYLGNLLEQKGEAHHQQLDTPELTELLDQCWI